MLVTNFRVKYILYKIVNGLYQLADVGRIHPMRERSLRALQRSVDYIEKAMSDALGFTMEGLLRHDPAADENGCPTS